MKRSLTLVKFELLHLFFLIYYGLSLVSFLYRNDWFNYQKFLYQQHWNDLFVFKKYANIKNIKKKLIVFDK